MRNIIFMLVVFFAILACGTGCQDKSFLENNEPFIYGLCNSRFYIINLIIMVVVSLGVAAFWCFVSYQYLFVGEFDFLVMLLFILLTVCMGTLVSIIYSCLWVRSTLKK